MPKWKVIPRDLRFKVELCGDQLRVGPTPSIVARPLRVIVETPWIAMGLHVCMPQLLDVIVFSNSSDNESSRNRRPLIIRHCTHRDMIVRNDNDFDYSDDILVRFRKNPSCVVGVVSVRSCMMVMVLLVV